MPEDQNNVRLACPIHGEAPFLVIGIDGNEQFFCVVCLRDVLTRMGVRGMFPTAGDQQQSATEAVEWPEQLEINEMK